MHLCGSDTAIKHGRWSEIASIRIFALQYEAKVGDRYTLSIKANRTKVMAFLLLKHLA